MTDNNTAVSNTTTTDTIRCNSNPLINSVSTCCINTKQNYELYSDYNNLIHSKWNQSATSCMFYLFC